MKQQKQCRARVKNRHDVFERQCDKAATRGEYCHVHAPKPRQAPSFEPKLEGDGHHKSKMPLGPRL
jgi:hypothetical protein